MCLAKRQSLGLRKDVRNKDVVMPFDYMQGLAEMRKEWGLAKTTPRRQR